MSANHNYSSDQEAGRQRSSDVIVGKKGRIVGGEQVGDYIVVQDDAANTGGYLILTSPDKSFLGRVFDNWAASTDDARRIFTGFKWEIEWLDEEDTSQAA